MTTLLDPALTAARTHHEDLRHRLVRHTEYLIATVATKAPHAPAQRRLMEFLHDELMPHAAAEEDLLTAAAETEATALLARAMLDEHRLLAALVGVVERATDPLDAAIAAGSLAVLFDVCALLEDQELLPALAETDVDLAGLFRDAPEITGDTGARVS